MRKKGGEKGKGRGDECRAQECEEERGEGVHQDYN